MIDPVPGILFRTGVVGTPLAAAGGVLLARWWSRRRKGMRARRSTFVAAMVAFALAGAIFAIGGYAVVCEREDERRLTFTYSAFLDPNGTGEVIVTLPIPINGVLIADLHLFPATSTAAINESGAEPALDIRLTTQTWTNASFSRVLPSGVWFPSDLTRTEDCVPSRTCRWEVALSVLQGQIHDVAVDLHAMWGSRCRATWLGLQATVVPGVHTYLGEGVQGVC